MADLGHLDTAAGRQRTAELLEHLDLAEAARKPAGTYWGVCAGGWIWPWA